MAVINSLVVASNSIPEKEEDADLYFISTHALDVQAGLGPIECRRTGTLVVKSETFEDQSVPNIFVVGHVALSELMCMQNDGCFVFIISP